MPELPEVETVRRSLEGRLTGRIVRGVRIGEYHGVIAGGDFPSFDARLRGRIIQSTRRRAKYILIDLDDDAALVVHLGMTGNLVLLPASAPPIRFEHLSIQLDDNSELRYADQRKFGHVALLLPDSLEALESKLGPEPLTSAFTVKGLQEQLARRTAPIKAALLDQRLIAGLGNIYADESLYRARIHPLRPCKSLTQPEIAALHKAIRSVLREGIENRGTSISHFRDGNGAEGENQSNLRVYGRGRSGQPCSRCGQQLTFIVVGGRSSHFCPSCQE